MQFNTLQEACQAIGDDFRDWERCEVVVFNSDEARDNKIVRWAFDCLMNPRNEWSGELLAILQAKHDEIKADLEATPQPVIEDFTDFPPDDLPF